ncbi:Senescence/dehydration-associated protein-related isoform 2 [Gossypium australe]|uniref:Senescence/dehydration-associated protein-related isoform 2 n=1 Tax=Gossypium australe TaxID=47621 RepID=A0A5B6VGI0_9ROSI|nr:Senescence/dehydration-associated protein-related isoform 2 [Gossypium australe]
MQRFAPQPPTKTLKQELLLKIPRCTVHLMDDGDALELGKGEFKLVRVLDDDVPLATIVKVTDDLQWPLTKDEPVVKLDSVHYLFSLPVKDGKPLSYGVTFVGRGHGNSLSSLDSFLKEHSCFAAGVGSTGDKYVDWKAYAPRIEDYNNVLAKAIAGGTGQIVKGIFTCSNAYISQVQKGGETILRQPPGKTHGIISSKSSKSKSEANNNNLKRFNEIF